MNPLLLLLLLLFSSLNPSSSASNSISSNQTLSGTQKLISDGGNFALGFFKPGKPNYYYIGIWYNNISKQTPVWVASRDTPITDPTTTHLKISAGGNLVLSNRSNPNIWSTNILANTSSSTTVAVLLDTGNLVIRDASNPNTTLWQSIDHPTDTLIPGGKLGRNKVTGVSQHLTSWKSTEDPSSGLYHIELDPTSQYYIIWNNSKQYSTTGTWNGQFFSQIQAGTEQFYRYKKFDFWYVNDTTESYFTYTFENDSIIFRIIMDVSGQIQSQPWLPQSQEWNIIWSQPMQQCDVYTLCGPYCSCNQNVQPYCKCLRGFSEKSPTNWDLGDRSEGCVRNTPLQCSRNSSVEGSVGKDKFYAMSNTRLPDHPQTLVQAGSASDCEQACLNNCSCTAYSYGSSSGCSVWHDDLLNLQEQVSSSGGTLFLRLAASEIIDSPKSNKGTVIRAITAGGVAGCLILLVVVWVLIWRWRRRGMAMAVVGGLLAFRYSDLQRATNNFLEKLGGGAFGSVFKGILPNSTAVAVKKLEGLRQGEKQFRTEVSTIGTVQHVNLVRLHGFCSQGKEKLLVYEYMPNGSLDTHLFQDNSGTTAVPDWKTRYQIALGTARGLTYLHEQCRDCIIHCDIKPENILLDAHLVPKVADFGMAKLVGRDFSRVLTTMRGTIGYLAPEWISGVAITAKADVYSYGMMLFEIISGKRNLDQDKESKIGFLLILAATKLMEGDDMVSLLDQRLEGVANAEEVTRACKVACWRIQDNADSRPTMGQVVQMLEGLVEVNIPPMPRALQLLADNSGNIVFYSELISNSSQT